MRAPAVAPSAIVSIATNTRTSGGRLTQAQYTQPVMRRGADYLASLRDGRAIFLDGKRVDDVTTHPAFAESIRRIAERYDAARHATGITPGDMWLIPRTAEDLGRRRAVHRFWAEGSYGLMGRTPDH